MYRPLPKYTFDETQDNDITIYFYQPLPKYTFNETQDNDIIIYFYRPLPKVNEIQESTERKLGM